MLATANTRKIGRGFGKNAGEWTGRVEISKKEIPGSKRSMYGYILTYLLTRNSGKKEQVLAHLTVHIRVQHVRGLSGKYSEISASVKCL